MGSVNKLLAFAKTYYYNLPKNYFVGSGC